MFRIIIYITLLVSISGCVIPVSSSCMDSQKYEHLDAYPSHSTSKCSAADAAVYVVAATIKVLDNEDEKTDIEVKKAVKCSDMVGKAQKECVRKEQLLYDPLDEL